MTEEFSNLYWQNLKDRKGQLHSHSVPLDQYHMIRANNAIPWETLKDWPNQKSGSSIATNKKLAYLRKRKIDVGTPRENYNF